MQTYRMGNNSDDEMRHVCSEYLTKGRGKQIFAFLQIYTYLDTFLYITLYLCAYLYLRITMNNRNFLLECWDVGVPAIVVSKPMKCCSIN